MMKYLSGIKEEALPVTALPADEGTSVDELLAWVEKNREEVFAKVHESGALLLRGFGFRDASEFERFSRTLCPELQSYVGGNSPRHRVEGAVYTSTEYPPKARISLHNEASYLKEIPRHIMFFCEVPAEVGGQTPLADCRGILSRIRDDVRERFDTKKVRYVNNLNPGSGMGRSWQEAFESDDRSVVEERLKAGGYEYTWKPDGGLRTSIVADATRRHPVTGEDVWINQAEQWHPSSLDPKTRQTLGTLMSEEEFPHYATFGDRNLGQGQLVQVVLIGLLRMDKGLYP